MTRLMITGTNSGCGKTTVTCAVLSALAARGLDITAFKCGPDYIDPMFHRETAGVRAYNLDPFFLDEDGLREHLARHAGRDASIIEGAMGYFDGIAGTDLASSYAAARATATPVVLTVDARGVGNSIAAVLEGFRGHRPDGGIRGVIFNGITAARYPDMVRLAEGAGLIPLGYLPFDKENSVGSRHLGLITAGEIADIKGKLARLGQLAEQTLDIGGLLALAGSAPPLSEYPALPVIPARVRIAVSRDEAFCFMYEENLEILHRLGGEIVTFSPLHDTHLPPDIGALWLCGGYPELHAERLSRNTGMLADIKRACDDGMPVIAECGGFMALHDALGGYPMAGVIHGGVSKTERLQRFGYVTLTAESDNLLCERGGEFRAHEFHYWDSSEPGGAFTARKAGRDIVYRCAHASETLYAGFPHIYLTENMAKRFMERAEEYAAKGAC